MTVGMEELKTVLHEIAKEGLTFDQQLEEVGISSDDLRFFVEEGAYHHYNNPETLLKIHKGNVDSWSVGFAHGFIIACGLRRKELI